MVTDAEIKKKAKERYPGVSNAVALYKRDLSKSKKRYPEQSKYVPPPIEEKGGYFVNPKTGETVSSSEDLTQQGYIRTATMEEIRSGDVTYRPDVYGGVYFGNTTVKNLEIKQQEQIGYYQNPVTGETVSSTTETAPPGYTQIATQQAIRQGKVVAPQLLTYSKPTKLGTINPKTGKPYGVLSKAPTVGERYKTATQQYKVQGSLDFLGSEIVGGYDVAVQKAYTSSKTTGGKSYASKYFISPGGLEQGSKAVSIAPYFIPYGVGSALLIAGGTEKAVKGETIQEKAFGVGEAGLGIIGFKSELSAFQTSRALKSPIKTTFLATERAGKSASDIKIISKTRIGRQTYIGTTKQKAVDFIYDTKLGVSKGLVFKGTSQTTKYGSISRVNPFKSEFISLPVGQARQVSLNFAKPLRITKEAGEGIISVARVKTPTTEPILTRLAGGVRPLKSGYYKFAGTSTPKQILGQVRGEPNVFGLIYRTSEPAARITKSRGVALKTLSTSKLAQKGILATAQSQRAAALSIARQQTTTSSLIGASARTTGVSLSLLETPKRTVRQTAVTSQALGVKQTQQPRTKTATATLTQQTTRTRQTTTTRTTPRTVQVAKVLGVQAQAIRTTPALKTKQATKTQQRTAATTQAIGFNINTGRGGFGFPFTIPRYSPAKKTKLTSRRFKLLNGGRRAYTPSAGAVTLGIGVRGKKAKTLKSQKVFSGIELRPVLLGNGKRKSKRKKRGKITRIL